MTYAELREMAATGDVFFTASHSIISRLIRFFTRSKVSHTGVLVWTEWAGQKRLMVCEYITSGFHTTFASTYFAECKKNNENLFFGEIKEKNKEYKILKNIEKYSSGQYDVKGALVSIMRTKEDENFYCSEFVAKVLNLSKNASSKGFTPDDIAEKCSFIKKIV